MPSATPSKLFFCSNHYLVHLERATMASLSYSRLPAKAGLARLSYTSGRAHGICSPVRLGSPCATPFFSTTSAAHLRAFTPEKEMTTVAQHRRTSPAWKHHGYTKEELLGIVPAHRKPQTVGDWLAWKLVRICRWGMDFATGMRAEQQVDQKHPTTALAASKPLTEAQWLVRFIFLESIAGVPGMVAGMLRHLRSLRLMRRDHGWIETLLEESYNERMHLLTFMKMGEPGLFMKTMILGAQGVFFNAMFLSYLVWPNVTHRFVGYLEEEAVHTYTRCLKELDEGKLPSWSHPDFKVPHLAINYWRMPEGHRTMKDLLLYIRADEAVHRGVNHTLSNLDQVDDPNPFVHENKPYAHKATVALKPTGYERSEVIDELPRKPRATESPSSPALPSLTPSS